MTAERRRLNGGDSLLSCVAPQINRAANAAGFWGRRPALLQWLLLNLSGVKKGPVVFSKSVKGCRWWTNGCVWLSDLREVQPEGNFEGFFYIVLDGSVILSSAGLQSDSVKFELSNLITNWPRLFQPGWTDRLINSNQIKELR